MEKRLFDDFSRALRFFPCFPCVLVTTDENIITIAMVHIFSFSPPLIGIGVSPDRYSHSLLKKFKEFVVNIPTKELLEKVSFCGENSGRDIDKFKATGLEKEKSMKVSAPSIKDCPANLECKVIKEIETGDHTWFIGKVLSVRVAKDYNKEEAILYWGGLYRIPGKVIARRH